MTDLTRRNLLGAAATIAAATAAVVALPAAAQAAPVHTAVKLPAGSQRDAWNALTATLSEEQMQLLYLIDAEHSEGWIDEQGLLVEELQRHLPAFTIAIQLAYEHVADQRVALRGRCCSGTAVEGEYRYI